MKMNQWKFNYKIENNFASEFFVTTIPLTSGVSPGKKNGSYFIVKLGSSFRLVRILLGAVKRRWSTGRLTPLYSICMLKINLKINLKRCLSLLRTFLLSFSLSSSRWGCSSQFWIIVSSAIVRKYGTVCNVQSLSSAIIRRVILVSFPVFKLLATIFWFFIEFF